MQFVIIDIWHFGINFRKIKLTKHKVYGIIQTSIIKKFNRSVCVFSKYHIQHLSLDCCGITENSFGSLVDGILRSNYDIRKVIKRFNVITNITENYFQLSR